MKNYCFLFFLLFFSFLSAEAQQIIYPSLKALVEERGDTVTTLRVERRTKNLIYAMGGADYRISVDENSGMSRYLRSRCYAVRVDTALYLNCKKMRYQRYRFGKWYAPALEVAGRVFFRAHPLGQEATRNILPVDATKLGGELGDAINASGLVDERVYYELDLESGKAVFVSKEYMHQLLAGQPALQDKLEEEQSEAADVIGKYLKQLK
ncbi:MAG: hypothetical protein J6C87_09155 [Bacteroides sp.]|nr:hypothetical protein [Bacteroides sp.]